MKRVFAGLLVLMASVALGLSAARPAMANGQSANGCNDVGATNIRVCLYNSVGFSKATGFWQRDYNSVGGVCQNLSNHTWHTGGTVNNTASSLIISNGTLPDGYRWRVRFYDHVNCSSANGYLELSLLGSDSWNVVGDLFPRGLNNSIGSVQIFFQAV
jgi:hypothetical protein